MLTSSLYEEVNDALATEYGLKALRIISENVEKDPANVRAKQQMAKTYSRLGVTLDNEGKSAESISYLEKAVAILQEIVRSQEKNRRFTHDLATAFIRLGDSRRKQRNFSAAVLDLEKAAAILIELVKSDPNDNASLRNLANASASMAKAHEELAKISSPEEAPSHRRSAQQQFQRAVNSLQQLEKRNALSKYDRKSLEELQLALQKSANDQ
jgi:tetratricopeptide (TPR) repeat protein